MRHLLCVALMITIGGLGACSCRRPAERSQVNNITSREVSDIGVLTTPVGTFLIAAANERDGNREYLEVRLRFLPPELRGQRGAWSRLLFETATGEEGGPCELVLDDSGSRVGIYHPQSNRSFILKVADGAIVSEESGRGLLTDMNGARYKLPVSLLTSTAQPFTSDPRGLSCDHP